MAQNLALAPNPRPGELSATESQLRAAFLAEVDRIPGGDRLRRCIQCGTCSGSCPVSFAMDVQPRQLVAYFRAGDLQSILKSRTIWLCASCYACTVRCPAGIKVTDMIYGLKRLALDRHLNVKEFPVHVLSEEFVRLVNRYGRNQERKLLTRYFRRASPMRFLAMAGLALRLVRAGRMQWKTSRVKGLRGLRKIIARAETMEAVHPREVMEPLGDVGYGVVAERPAPAAGGPTS